ncbi:hypothetical protein KUCAC02_021490 [Chaenocephalus aceratus]|uniref:Uncharacterized protein n=1 Tax=Chaenocephalus aceratus TaxID=36190 RepID=A0ACB9XFP7_CHAAC|nr:hypothetical protein KUCAC02_021490 [Chaenocephalus aceratus]
MSATVSEQIRHTGSVLPVGRMNMNESTQGCSHCPLSSSRRAPFVIIRAGTLTR